jgi:hypothetical protein
MPPQQRVRLNEERSPALPRDAPRKRSQQSSIRWFELRPSALASKHRQLMTQDEDLQINATSAKPLRSAR